MDWRIAGGVGIWLIIIVVVGFALAGCGHKIVRDADTFHVEVMAAQARQTEAMRALLEAADAALMRGDREACERYARPALLIEAFAENQAQRALYLAGLIDEDPGPSPTQRPVAAVCGVP